MRVKIMYAKISTRKLFMLKNCETIRSLQDEGFILFYAFKATYKVYSRFFICDISCRHFVRMGNFF